MCSPRGGWLRTIRVPACAHRLAAAKLLGWESIDTVEVAGGELTAQLAEIDENLCRSELTPTQEAEHLARRKEVWEAMREAERAGQDLAGNTGATCTDIPDRGPGRPAEFASETAAATGKDKSTINRAIKRANAVCQAARDLIRGTKLDTGSYLDSIARRGMSEEEQVQHVKDALADLADRERRKA